MSTYSPEQITAAHHLHDTCHELTGLFDDQPAALDGPIWNEWNDAYERAYRVHEDAEAEYRHAFPDEATRPEAHEVLAAELRELGADR